jgi:hypothetical protein
LLFDFFEGHREIPSFKFQVLSFKDCMKP